MPSQNFKPIKFNLNITHEIILSKITEKFIYISAITKEYTYVLIRIDANQNSSDSIAFIHKHVKIDGEVIDFNEDVTDELCIITLSDKSRYIWEFNKSKPMKINEKLFNKNNPNFVPKFYRRLNGIFLLDLSGNISSFQPPSNGNAASSNLSAAAVGAASALKSPLATLSRTSSTISSSGTGSGQNQIITSINEKPTGYLHTFDSNIELISTKNKLYTWNGFSLQKIFDINITMPEENLGVSGRNFNISNGSYNLDNAPTFYKKQTFLPTENCLYENHGKTIWYTCHGIYLLNSDTLLNLEKLELEEFYSQQENKNFEIKSMAVTNYNIAILLENKGRNSTAVNSGVRAEKCKKIVIFCLLNHKILSIIDVTKLDITNLLTSKYYFNPKVVVDPIENISFWAVTSKNLFIMFDGMKAGKMLYKIALSMQDFGLARNLLIEFLDESEVELATEKIDFNYAEYCLENNWLKKAANYYSKCRNLEISYRERR